MIIQVRGTSGCGKTTVVRTVMNLLGGQPKVLKPIYVPERKRPLYYTDGRISVIGSYENPCGGCDTISGYITLVSLVREQVRQGPVLMEGLLLSEDVKNTLTLPRERLRILFLNTPLDVCLDRIKARRKAKGNDKPLSETNTANRVKTIARARTRLEEAGIDCRTTTCDQAPKLILQWLRREET